MLILDPKNLPKMDQAMHRRFTHFLKLPERCAYAWISPAIWYTLSLRSVTVVSLFDGKNSCLSTYAQKRNLMILGKLKPVNNPKFWNFRTIQNTSFALTDVALSNMQISKEMLYLMLTPKVDSLSMESVNISSPLTFKEVITKVPQVQHIKILDANLIFDDNWTILLREKCKLLNSCDFTSTLAFANVPKLLDFFKPPPFNNVSFFKS